MTDYEEVRAVIDREAAAIEAGDIKAYTAILSDDAEFLPPGTSAKKGAELHRWLDDFLRTFRIHFLSMDHPETVVVGDIAYHVFYCSWQASPRAGGEPREMRFKGIHILKRETGGNWKLAREIWNT